MTATATAPTAHTLAQLVDALAHRQYRLWLDRRRAVAAGCHGTAHALRVTHDRITRVIARFRARTDRHGASGRTCP